MKKSLKKIVVGTAFSVASLSLFSFSSTESANVNSEALGNGGPTVTCPSGDWHKCYEFPNGGIVYKGQDGETTIQF